VLFHVPIVHPGEPFPKEAIADMAALAPDAGPDSCAGSGCRL